VAYQNGTHHNHWGMYFSIEIIDETRVDPKDLEILDGFNYHLDLQIGGISYLGHFSKDVKHGPMA
jgi:hypothetical protein